MEILVGWLICLSAVVVVLCVAHVVLARKHNKLYFANENLRARVNPFIEKGDKIRMAVRPIMKEPGPVEFNFKGLTRGDSFENIEL